MEFNKYPHLERFGADEVDNINAGECWIFPKLDGANAQVWFNKGLQFGSRNRDLAGGNDLMGFRETYKDSARLSMFFERYPNCRLYGEWLVPHAFTGYRDECWRKLWIFDVSRVGDDGIEHFLPYDVYEGWLRDAGLDYVLPINRVTNPRYENLLLFLPKATFLCRDDAGPGEGIVIKNYGFYNKYGRQTWAKLVRQEFKEQHARAWGVDNLEIADVVEAKIVRKYVTKVLVEKELSKIIAVNGSWSSRNIPRLLETVFHCLVTEELWSAIKEHKNPTIDFKTLKALTINEIKKLKPGVFG